MSEGLRRFERVPGRLKIKKFMHDIVEHFKGEKEMGKCDSYVREVRFVIEDELTHCYVMVDAGGDCPIGVQGCHHKAFGKSMAIIDILQSKDFGDYLLWGLEAPQP
jgi:hypothetical protein